MHQEKQDIGLIGLATMGQNLALNIADHRFGISVYNRTPEKTDVFMASHGLDYANLKGYHDIKEFITSLKSPKKVIILVKAGAGTEAVIKEIAELMSEGDIIIDGGNAHWEDSIRREKELKEKGIKFMASGVSGGEEGARFGPSLMPSGDFKAWEAIKPIWEAIAAKVDASGKQILNKTPKKIIQDGVPCTSYIGENGSGHYVKMVHNGIEYADMQMICEAYQVMRDLLALEPSEIGKIFQEWNKGPLDSFLIEITADILNQKDPLTKKAFVDIVLDAAGQKGTGKWTSVSALDLGVPSPTIAESVFSRCMSAIKEERVNASKVLKGPSKKFSGNKDDLIQAIHDGLYCSKICSYAQGFQLMKEAQKNYNWKLNFSEISKIWRGGCIIRAALLQKISSAFEKNPGLENILLDEYFNKCLESMQENWRKTVVSSIEHGIPMPTFSSALAYYDSYRTANLPQNLLQAQRDYFGAHTFERTDKPRGEFFHLDWPNKDRPLVSV